MTIDAALRAVVNEAATALFPDVIPLESGPAIDDVYVGTIGFASDSARGALVWSIARSAASALSGVDDEAMIVDWVSEMANQLLGRVKNQLAARGLTFQVGTPVVAFGRCLASGGAVSRVSCAFLSPAGTFRVAVDAQLDPDLVLHDVPDTSVAAEGTVFLF